MRELPTERQLYWLNHLKTAVVVRVAAPRGRTHRNAKASLVMPNNIRLERQGVLQAWLILLSEKA